MKEHMSFVRKEQMSGKKNRRSKKNLKIIRVRATGSIGVWMENQGPNMRDYLPQAIEMPTQTWYSRQKMGGGAQPWANDGKEED